MYSTEDISNLLDRLDSKTADELEDQFLDFKEWNCKSKSDAIRLVTEMAVCMANGGGGTIVFGVRDKAIGRANAILGVPHEIDIERLKQAVFDSTDPKILPHFEELKVTEGTGRLLIMLIMPSSPIYTTTAGLAKIRIGKDCKSLTGSVARRIIIMSEMNIVQKSTEGPKPLEFRTELRRNIDLLKLILYFKNNTKNPIRIELYRIEVTKGDKIIHSTGFKNGTPIFHTYGRIVDQSDKEQVEEFDWFDPHEWNINDPGIYQIQTEIMYKMDGETKILSYPIVLSYLAEVAKVQF